MKDILYVFVGGGIGSVLRYEVSVAWRYCVNNDYLCKSILPWPTLIVNVLGCFLIGLFYEYAGRWGLSNDIRLILTTGLCGGFTTFSTFSYEGMSLIRTDHITYYILYILLSIVLGAIAVALPILIHEN